MGGLGLPHRTLRTIGAAVILVGVAVAGVAQIASFEEDPPAQIVTGEPTATSADPGDRIEPSTTIAEHFTYRVGVFAGISTDNFWAFYGSEPSVWNSYVLGPTKPALFTAAGSGGALRPELAGREVAPIQTERGWEVTVPLNRDLAWSDGVPVTADDVVFTFETVRRLRLGGSWSDAFPQGVKKITAVGEHEVRIEFAKRPQLSVWPHGVGLAPVMAEHVWEGAATEATRKSLYALPGDIDVSGGPLAITSVSNDVIVSRANPGYSLATVPDNVEYHVFQSEVAAVNALARGDIDSVLSPKGLSPQGLQVLEAKPGVETVTNPGNGIRYLGFNLDRDPMSDRAFRTALALILDREDMAESIPHAGGPAWSLVPEANSRWFDASQSAETARRYERPLAQRLAEALEGLDTAGYAWEERPRVGPAGRLVAGSGLTIGGQTPAPLTILTPGDDYDPARPDYVRQIAGALSALGFDARPVETDFDTVVDLAFTPDEAGALHYDMYVLGWTLGSPALPGYYGTLFAADGAMNNTGYDNDRFGRALAQYQAAHTTGEAKTALWAMERQLATDLPYLPLYSSEITEAYRSDRVTFALEESLGGLQARLGGIWSVRPAG